MKWIKQYRKMESLTADVDVFREFEIPNVLRIYLGQEDQKKSNDLEGYKVGSFNEKIEKK